YRREVIAGPLWRCRSLAGSSRSSVSRQRFYPKPSRIFLGGMMKPYTLCYFSATAMELPSLSEGVRQFQNGGGRITVHARTQTQLFDRARQKAFVDQALASDALIVTLHGGKASFPAFEALIRALDAIPEDRRPYLHIQPTSGDEDSADAAREHSPDFGTPTWDEIRRYLSYGGHVNFHQLLIFLYNRLFD